MLSTSYNGRQTLILSRIEGENGHNIKVVNEIQPLEGHYGAKRLSMESNPSGLLKKSQGYNFAL